MFERFTCPMCGGHEYHVIQLPDGAIGRECKGPKPPSSVTCRFQWMPVDDAKYIAQLSERVDRVTDRVESAVVEVGQAGRAIGRLAGTAKGIFDRVRDELGPHTRLGKRDVPRR